MKLKKPKHWDYKKPNIVAYLLLPFSLILLTVNFFKQLITKFTNKNHTEIKTICVGNIYTGGTGKTPAAKEIFQITKSLGKNPAFIKKYYDYVNDEINMLKNIGETFVSKKRETSIKNLVKNGYNLAILDDGFQDFSIKNNLNIVCFNQKQWIGNGLIIPAGPLRESLAALKRADCVLINGSKDTEIENQIYNKNKNIKIFYSNYEPIDIDKFKEKKICAFAGIGNPSNFFSLLKDNNINLLNTFSFPDHHNYSLNEIKNISEKFDDCVLLTTEKDYYRLKPISFIDEFNIQYLQIRLKIKNKDDFIKLIREKI